MVRNYLPSVNSVPAVALPEFAAKCIEAIKAGRKRISYRCASCKAMRDVEIKRPAGHVRIQVTCGCGHVQFVHMFR